jgi:hypothetical protein
MEVYVNESQRRLTVSDQGLYVKAPIFYFMVICDGEALTFDEGARFSSISPRLWAWEKPSTWTCSLVKSYGPTIAILNFDEFLTGGFFFLPYWSS